MTTTHFTGSKYEATKGMDIAAVAELVRSDIKAAIAAGELPAGLKTSVRISRYSMGKSLSVTVTAAPFVVNVPEEQVDDNRAQGLKCPWLTREAVAVLETLEGIREAYNYDRSDWQSDYYCSRFGGSVDFQIKAPKSAPKARPVTLPVESGLPVASNDSGSAELAARLAELDAFLSELETAPASMGC